MKFAQRLHVDYILEMFLSNKYQLILKVAHTYHKLLWAPGPLMGVVSVARALNAGCADILWRYLLRVSSSLALVRSERSLGIHSVFCLYLAVFICAFYCMCLLG